MKQTLLVLAALALTAMANAQTMQTPPTTAVPRLVRFSGTIPSGSNSGQLAGITFALYKEQTGGAPLWLETQNVSLDSQGRYTVQLGAATKDGLPVDLFTSAEAQWLGVQAAGQDELPRVLLMSVPYALKAVDAETVGGLPASAFILAQPSTPAQTVADSSDGESQAIKPPATITGLGTTNFLPLWTGTTTIGNSILFESGTGKFANVGINNSAPATTLDVGGAATIRGLLNSPAVGTASATAAFNSQPVALSASAFNSSSASAATQNFRWQAEPVSNNSSTASGTLNLLFGQGTATPAETGLKIASNGQITFAPGQTFPGGSGGSGSGTVTSVGLSAPTSDFTVTGSPVTTSGTLGLNWSIAPTSVNTVNAIVKRDANGSFTGTSIVGTTNNVLSAGVLGTSTATGVGAAYGVEGTAVSDSGAGVFGYGGGTYGVGVSGFSFGTSGYGMYGYASAANGTGVYGQGGNTGAGVSAHGGSYGLYAVSSLYGVNSSGTYAGVAGYGTPASGTYYANWPWGVLGNTASPGGIALAAIAEDGTGLAASNSSNLTPTATFTNDGSSTAPILMVGDGVKTSCLIDNAGNLFCGGSKSAVVPVDHESRRVALYAVESPENWFEDFGSGQLRNGHVTVNLDPVFSQTVNTESDYHIFLTPRGDCKGLFVANQTTSGFEVRELGEGNSAVKFDYRIVARRKGYESIRMADMTERLQKLQENMPKRMKGSAPSSLSAKVPLPNPVSGPPQPGDPE